MTFFRTISILTAIFIVGCPVEFIKVDPKQNYNPPEKPGIIGRIYYSGKQKPKVAVFGTDYTLTQQDATSPTIGSFKDDSNNDVTTLNPLSSVIQAKNAYGEYYFPFDLNEDDELPVSALADWKYFVAWDDQNGNNQIDLGGTEPETALFASKLSKVDSSSDETEFKVIISLRKLEIPKTKNNQVVKVVLAGITEEAPPGGGGSIKYFPLSQDQTLENNASLAFSTEETFALKGFDFRLSTKK